AAAQQTPQGKARIALISAVSDTPGWVSAASPEPAANDFISQEQKQFSWQSKVDFAFAFAARAELEMRAGGNPSWNTGVDYSRQLERSADRKEVEALYKQAGLNLNHDLDMLEDAPRIAADPQAKAYLSRFVTFNGELDMPVLSMHTTGDGLVVNQDEQAYNSAVRQGDDANMLRQIFVHRAGHCTFTPGETVAAFQTLIHRIDHGTWGNSTDPSKLNQEGRISVRPSTLFLLPSSRSNPPSSCALLTQNRTISWNYNQETDPDAGSIAHLLSLSGKQGILFCLSLIHHLNLVFLGDALICTHIDHLPVRSFLLMPEMD